MLLLLDQINLLMSELESGKELPLNSRSAYIEDTIEDILLYAYALGRNDVADMLGGKVKGLDDPKEFQKAYETINKKIDGKTYTDRIKEYIDAGASHIIVKSYVFSDGKICYNNLRRLTQSGYDTAVTLGAKYKVWNTMLDDKVRDTHDYIEGSKVPIDAYFYTFDGDSAKYPGGFDLPENNINCRCTLMFVK